jgi:hypothetical protein
VPRATLTSSLSRSQLIIPAPITPTAMSSSEDEYDPAGALDDIESTLDTLETILEPLLSGKMMWEEILERESGDHMGRAKLSMMMAFGVCDLLFGESQRMRMVLMSLRVERSG